MSFEQTSLDRAVAAAFAQPDQRSAANHVWIELLRAPLCLPVDPNPPQDSEEAFHPLYAKVGEHYFLAAFDTPERLTTWAGASLDKMAYVTLSGRELIAGMGEGVFLALNVGTPFYKEFSPDEVKHLKKIVARLEGLRGS